MQEKKFAKNYRLLYKKVFLTAILTFFSFLIGYIYTERWKAFLCLLLMFLLGLIPVTFLIGSVLGFSSTPEPGAFEGLFALYWLICFTIAAIENTLAVRNAKKFIRHHRYLNEDNNSFADLKSKLFSAIASKGEMSTIACIERIEDSEPRIRLALVELEDEQRIQLGQSIIDNSFVYRKYIENTHLKDEDDW